MIRNYMTALKVGLASAAVLFAAQTAQAAPITVDSVGDSFTVVFDGNVEGDPIAGLTAEAKFTVTSFSQNQAKFDVELKNTSVAPVGSRVSIIGFNTDPDLSGVDAEGTFDVWATNSTMPNGFGAIEVCFKDGGGPNCNGGGGAGPLNGQTITFDITLDFADSILGGLTLDNFGVRYQSITGVTGGTSGTGQGTVPGTPGSPGSPGDPGDPTPVPEPASMLLLGGGLAGLALKRMRRNRA